MSDEPRSQLDQREMSRKALARARSELLGLRTHLTSIDDAYRSGPPLGMESVTVAAMHDSKSDQAASAGTSYAFDASNAVTTEVTAGAHGLQHEAHRAEIAAVKRRAAAASTPRLAAESASIIAHANIEIESANTEIARLAAELTSTRASHEAEVAALRERVASTESKHAALEAECARLRRLLAETAAMADSHSTAAREAKDLHGKTQAAAALVEEEASRLERETAEAMEELRKQHAEAVAGHGALESEMAVEYVENIGALKIEHAQGMMAVQSQHDEAVRALRANHAEELKRVRAAHEEELSVQRQAHESAIAALTNVVRARGDAFVALQDEHKTVHSSKALEESHRAAVKAEHEEDLSQQISSPAQFVPSAVAASPASRYTKAAAQFGGGSEADAFPSMAAAMASPSSASMGGVAQLSANALQQWHEAQQQELARLFQESQKMQHALTAQHQQTVASAHWDPNTIEEQPPSALADVLPTAQDNQVLTPSPRRGEAPESAMKDFVTDAISNPTSATIQASQRASPKDVSARPAESGKVAAAMLPKPAPPSTPGRGPEADPDSTQVQVVKPGSARKSVDWASAAALAVARSKQRVASQSSSPVRTPKRPVALLAPPTSGSNVASASDSSTRTNEQRGGISELHSHAAVGHSSSKLAWPKAPASPGSPNRRSGKNGEANQFVPSLALPPAPSSELVSAAVAFKQEAAKLLKTPPRVSAKGGAAPEIELDDPELAALSDPDADSGLLARSPRGKTVMVLAAALPSLDDNGKRSGNARVAARDKALWAAAAEHATAVASGRLVGPAKKPEPEPEP